MVDVLSLLSVKAETCTFVSDMYCFGIIVIACFNYFLLGKFYLHRFFCLVFFQVYTILSFATRAARFCRNCYGVAVIGVQGGGGFWLAGKSTSLFLDVDLSASM